MKIKRAAGLSAVVLCVSGCLVGCGSVSVQGGGGAAHAAGTEGVPVGGNQGPYAELDAYVDKLTSHYPGLWYGAITADSELYSRGAGLADFSAGELMSESTVMNVFSISKLFTSLVVLQLVDEGLVDLDLSMSTYLPWIPYEGTVRQFLSHSAGVPNPIWGSFYIHWEDAHGSFDRDAFLRQVIRKNAKAEFAPGDKVLYSNLGYAVLGALIEERTGMRYEEAVAERVLVPLGLSSAGFNPTKVSPLSGSYVSRSPITRIMMKLVMDGITFRRAGRFNSIPSLYYFDFPAHGGLVISPEDLAAFLQAVVRRDARLLSPCRWDRWFEPQAAGEFALGWRVEETANGRVLSHAGGAIGHAALVRYYLDYGVATYFQSNILDSMRIERRDMGRMDAMVLSGDPRAY